MSTNATHGNESTDTELDERDRRALEQYLTVLPEAPGLFRVVSESGSAYTVDTREGRCTCPDHKHRGVRCKHLRRVAFATGERPIPATVDREAIDEHLGRHVDGGPRVVATDGGSNVIDAGDEGVILEDGDTRPEDCGCWNTEQGLPCWPCYRETGSTPRTRRRPARSSTATGGFYGLSRARTMLEKIITPRRPVGAVAPLFSPFRHVPRQYRPGVTPRSGVLTPSYRRPVVLRGPL
jgi:hypothetical protein